jgi:glutamine synthetase type III
VRHLNALHTSGIEDLVTEVQPIVAELAGSIRALEAANRDHPEDVEILQHAEYMRDTVIPAMNDVRAIADGLEKLIADDLWPLPKYEEMLFIKSRRRHRGSLRGPRSGGALGVVETELTLARGGPVGEGWPMTPISSSFAAALAAITLAVAGCGGDDDVDTDKIQQQGEELRQQGEELREKAEKTADDVRSGKKNAEEAAEELQQDSKELEEAAKDTASEAIDEVQDADIPDEAREELEKAQEDLEQAP